MKIETTKATIEGEKAKKIFTALKQTIEAISSLEENSKEETEDTESKNEDIPDKEKLVADIDELLKKFVSVVAQFSKIAKSDDTQLSIHLANTLYEKGLEFCKELNAVKSYLNEYNLRKSSEQ